MAFHSLNTTLALANDCSQGPGSLGSPTEVAASSLVCNVSRQVLSLCSFRYVQEGGHQHLWKQDQHRMSPLTLRAALGGDGFPPHLCAGVKPAQVEGLQGSEKQEGHGPA